MKFSTVSDQTQTSTIQMLAGITIILGFMYWARVIVIPIALSMLLTFLLFPVISWFEKFHIPRIPAVVFVTIVTFSLFIAVSYTITQQINSLIDSYSQYEDNVNAKIVELNQTTQDSLIDKISNLSERLYQQLQEANKNSQAGTLTTIKEDNGEKIHIVRIMEESPFQLSQLGNIIGPVLEPLANVGLVIVLVIFMLIHQEDLRDRFISLIGVGRIAQTTRALDDAGRRISRYLLMQLIINLSYGFAVGIGLWLLEIPYGLLWGSLAALLRYIPYLGTWLAALLPIALSLLISPEWSIAFKVIVLFLILELITNMIIEPVLYGKGIGISHAALLVAVAFWAWLWGPVGLILASPVTVCLVVLGQYVPFLNFIDILLGDKATLSQDHKYYQRLLADDEDEATEIIEKSNKDKSLIISLDEIVIPSLSLARADLRSNKLSELDYKRIILLNKEIIENVRNDHISDMGEKANDIVADLASDELLEDKETIILAISAKDDFIDQMMVDILPSLVETKRFKLIPMPASKLLSDVLKYIEETRPDVLTILSIPPGGISHIRYICKKVNVHFPDLKIVVGRLGVYEEDKQDNRNKFTEVNVKLVGFNVAELISELNKVTELNY